MPENKPTQAHNVPSPATPPPSHGNVPPGQTAASVGRKGPAPSEAEAEAQARHESRPVSGTDGQTQPGKLRNQ